MANSITCCSIYIVNDGLLTATNVLLTDELDQSATFISADNEGNLNGNQVEWNIANISPTTMLTYTVVVSLPDLADGTILTNILFIAADGNITATNLITLAVSNQPTALPQFNLTKTSPPEVSPESLLTYTITISNGGGMAGNTVMTDTLDANTTFVSANNNPMLNNGIVVWDIGDISNQAPLSYTVVVEVAPLTNTLIANNQLTNTVFLNSAEDISVSATVVTDVIIPETQYSLYLPLLLLLLTIKDRSV